MAYYPLRWEGSTSFKDELTQPFVRMIWAQIHETHGYACITFLRADGTGIVFWNQMQTIAEQLELGVLACQPINPDWLGPSFIELPSALPRAVTLLIIHEEETGDEAESGIVLTFEGFEVTIVADGFPCTLSCRINPAERFAAGPDHFDSEYDLADYTRLRVIPVT